MIGRGDIFFVDLDPVEGHEQGGERPVLVVSSERVNTLPLVVTVIVGTKGSRVTRDYPTNIRVPAKETGLRIETVFYAFQVRSLDQARFPARRSGVMPPRRMAEVDAALRLVLDLP